jgi:hypothetical protein
MDYHLQLELQLTNDLVWLHVRVLAGADPSGLTWQPWADQLVYMVLGALVWGGLALQDACPAEHSSLMDALGSYMAARPMQVRWQGFVVLQYLASADALKICVMLRGHLQLQASALLQACCLCAGRVLSRSCCA